MGVGWCGDVADAEAALQHTGQAVRYLLVGKDDCVRKATKVRTLLETPVPVVAAAAGLPGLLVTLWSA